MCEALSESLAMRRVAGESLLVRNLKVADELPLMREALSESPAMCRVVGESLVVRKVVCTLIT